MATIKKLRRRRRKARAALRKAKRLRVPGRARKPLRRVRVLLRKLIAALTGRIKRRRLGRVKPNTVYVRNSPNQSVRTTGIRLIVLHSTESPYRANDADLRGIADYFARSDVDASSHVITNGVGHSARCVPDSRKAWTQSAFNSPSLSIEQIGYASQDSWPEDQYRETARWIAFWSREHDIPIRRGAVSGYSVTRSGVITHAELGSPGGGHHDPGDAYRVGHVLKLAERYRAAL